MMADAQNERTKSQGRRRRRRPQRGRNERPAQHVEMREAADAPVPTPTAVDSAPRPEPRHEPEQPLVRPDEIAAPTDRYDVYCVHHMASRVEAEPIHTRINMTTLRHLAVDHFGEATLYCDCLHNGPHEWPPSLQKLETAVELDQFVAASTKEA